MPRHPEADRCLAAIDRLNPILDAFEVVDRTVADRAAPPGPLSGLVLAVKDNLDTADLPTGYGSPIHAGGRPAADAAAVALARKSGAVVIGKTVTTEFAASRVGRTGNPHRPDHTPGGSSSGSAAAVAAGMADVAFGTQTVGSVIRPAAFCGIVGFKPTFGAIPRAGLKVVADTIDTIGVFARDVASTERLFTAVSGIQPAPRPKPVGLPIAACATPWFGRVAADAQRHHAVVLDRLRAAGVDVVEITMPPAWTAMEDRHRTICQFEGARNMAHELRVARDRIGPDVLAQWEAGEATPWTAYATALDEARRWRAEWDRLTQSFAAVLTPAARGEAPAGRSDTGDPIMNMAFSFLRVPVLTLPTGHGDGGLPLGTQLAGLRRDDARLLATAAVIAELVGLGE